MARVIDKLPERRHVGRVRAEKYPAAWLDGQVWALLYGEDYQGTHSGFRSTVAKMAQRRGGIVTTRALREGDETIGFAIQYTQIRGTGEAA